MNYYKIVEVTPPSYYGTIPQSQKMTEGYDYSAPNSISKTSMFEKIENSPNFDAIHLEYGAKLTDWISSMNTIASQAMLIVSTKLSSTILTHKIQQELQVFDAYVMWRKKKYNYKALYSYNLALDYVDFKNSKLATIDWIMRSKIDDLTINSKEEFNSEKEYYRSNLRELKRYVSFSRLSLKKQINHDFFRLSLDGGASGYYVSEQLKNAIKEAECTGIAFTSVEGLNWVRE